MFKTNPLWIPFTKKVKFHNLVHTPSAYASILCNAFHSHLSLDPGIVTEYLVRGIRSFKYFSNSGSRGYKARVIFKRFEDSVVLEKAI